MELFLSALGLAMIMEGLPYFIAPRHVKEFAKRLPELSSGTIRSLGMAIVAAGLLVIYLARHFF
jgi:uncharacterized protein YjeT (DUF2065 family)